MFLGEYQRTRDNKGRVFIPSKLREDLIGCTVIAKGYDKQCLFLFSKISWNKLQEKILAGPIARKDTQIFSRWFFSSASEEEIDHQGRIKIPQNLADYAGLGKDVVLIGNSERIEIWDKNKWEKYYTQAESKFLKDSSTFEKLGF